MTTLRIPRAVASLFAAASLAVLPLTFAAPTAQAASGQCSFEWGIKNSYRSYIRGPIAKGAWKGDGIGFTGGETAPDGAFVFSPGKAQVDGDTVTIPFPGTLAFTGHDYGGGPLLDMTLSDWKVRASGTQAQILVDYVSYTSDMVDKTKKGDRITGDDTVLATINLNTPVDANAKAVDLTGSTYLAEGGHKLFMTYDVGTALDPASGTVATDGSCGSAGGTGTGNKGNRTLGTIKGNFTGFNKEAMAILSETNDTMNAMTTFMGNSEAFLDQLDSFQNRGQSTGNSAGSGSNTASTNSTTSGTGTSTGTGTASTGSGSGAGTSASTTGGGSAPAAGAPAAGGASQSGQPAKCDAVRAVTSANAAWAIKESFQSYITGSIAKGRWTLSGASHSGGKFQFTGSKGNVDTETKQGSVLYDGSVHFTGHNGVLDLKISNPEIHFNGNSGQIIAQVQSSNMEGKRRDFGRVAIANLQFSNLSVGDTVRGEASATLTSDGAHAFADFYEAGIQLAPISFSANLGGAGDCGAIGGSGASGNSSGGSGSNAQAAKDAMAQGTGADAGESGSAPGGDSATTGYDGTNKFKIKSAGESGASGFGDENALTYVLLILAAIAVAGGSMGRLVTNNPA